MREKDFGFIFWLAVFFICCIYLSDCEEEDKTRQTYVIRYKDGEQTIPVTVVLDYKKQTEYVINMNPRTPAKSVTLYDFKQRTIAYKDLTNRECFLGRLTHETLNEENSALQDLKNPVEVRPKIRSLDPKTPALTPTEIRNIAGQKTAVFCRKMNTWLLVPEKTHSIGKREADEFEERTFQYHGHRSSQYSHYERETRRRFRNSRKQPNFRRRSQNKESEADNEDVRLRVPESSPFRPNLNSQSSNGIHFPSGEPHSVSGIVLNHSSNYPVPPNPYLTKTNAYGDKENGRASFTERIPPGASNTHQNYRYHPNTDIKSSSSAEVPLYSRHISRDFNFNETDGSLDHQIIPDFTKNTSDHFKKSSSPEKLISDDTHSIHERSTTTNSPSIPFGQVGYPNVHSSLVHLLPLYKPLGQEFDFDQEATTKDSTDNQQKNIESENHLSPTTFIEPANTFTHLNPTHNVSQDPDVSINVVEVPKITKKFENVKDTETHPPSLQSENIKHLQSSVDNYPVLSQKQSETSPYFQKNNPQRHNLEHFPLPSSGNLDSSAKEEHFRGNAFHIPQSVVPTTTRLPVHNTQDYSTPEKTTLGPLYIPSVHTAFKNSEDFNTFQIFPNYIENVSPTSAGRNSIHDVSAYENTRVPQSLILTTEHPLKTENQQEDRHQRSDNNDLKRPFNHVTNTRRNSYTSSQNNTLNVDVPYRVRYQNVLRDFKPDEIIIDIENIPTHTPPPVTSRFQQRLFTTIQPTVKSLLPNSAKSDRDQRSEQVFSGTTWRSVYPTTRYPRRKISDKSHRPIQNSSVSFTQRNSMSRNHYQVPKPPFRIIVGVNRFSPAHHSHRRQFQYPIRPVPPSRVIMPSETNQLHHISDLNNLPPGVSVHPRHPQAPFADMVRLNRPPTIPFVDDNQVFMKPHRQRHHRKKEGPLNSCCRLRGQSGAFQSCCRNGGSCCSRSRRRMQLPGSQCCSSSNAIGQVIPQKQIQPPVRITNQTLPPIRTEKTHRSEADNKDRCQKEKMCRTLYESTQQVMVCRNAHIEGC